MTNVSAGAGGAEAGGPWIDTETKTWVSLAKTVVQGAVSWTQAGFSVSIRAASRVITGNDLPIDHATGSSPVASTDPAYAYAYAYAYACACPCPGPCPYACACPCAYAYAYAYDRDPNTITSQSISWSLPVTPEAGASHSCLGVGPIGILTDGVNLFDALEGEGRDAGAHEVLDGRQGHPQTGSSTTTPSRPA